MLRRPPRVGALLASLLLTAVLVVPAVAEPGPAQQHLAEERARLSAAERRLAALDARVSRAVEDYNQARIRLEDAQADLERARVRATSLRRQAAELGREVDTLVRRLHTSGSDSTIEALFAGPDSSRAVVLLERVTDRQMASAEALEASRRALAEQEARLAERRAEARTVAAELDRRRRTVEREVAAQRDEVAALRAQVAEAREASRAAERRAEARRRADARRRAEAERRAVAERHAEAEQRAVTEPRTEVERPAAPTAPSVTPERSSGQPRSGAETAVEAALSQVGKPYRWGGGGPDSYDCSGLTSWAWRHAGVSLPHSSRMQFDATRRISRAELAPGDLVFFGAPIHHVAMYVGDGRVVEAPYSGSNVRVNDRALARGDIAGYGRP